MEPKNNILPLLPNGSIPRKKRKLVNLLRLWINDWMLENFVNGKVLTNAPTTEIVIVISTLVMLEASIPAELRIRIDPLELSLVAGQTV